MLSYIKPIIDSLGEKQLSHPVALFDNSLMIDITESITRFHEVSEATKAIFTKSND